MMLRHPWWPPARRLPPPFARGAFPTLTPAGLAAPVVGATGTAPAPEPESAAAGSPSRRTAERPVVTPEPTTPPSRPL